MYAKTSSQFPDSFNRIKLRTIRRKKKQLQNLSSFPQPISEDTGVMIPGIIKNYDHLPLFPAHPEKSFQKSLKGFCVERRCLHNHQFSRADGDSAKKTHLLSCRCMQEDRVLQLRENPARTPRTMLLKMAFVNTPKINASPEDQSMEFFYMPSALPDQTRQLPLVVCGAGTPSCEKSVGTDEFPNQYRMSALCDAKAKSHPIAPGNNQTSQEIAADLLPSASTVHHSRKIVDHDPRHPSNPQNPLPDNAYTSTEWSEGNVLKPPLPRNCSFPRRAVTTHVSDGRTLTPRIWLSLVVKRLSLSRYHQNEISHGYLLSRPPRYHKNYLCANIYDAMYR